MAKKSARILMGFSMAALMGCSGDDTGTVSGPPPLFKDSLFLDLKAVSVFYAKHAYPFIDSSLLPDLLLTRTFVLSPAEETAFQGADTSRLTYNAQWRTVLFRPDFVPSGWLAFVENQNYHIVSETDSAGWIAKETDQFDYTDPVFPDEDYSYFVLPAMEFSEAFTAPIGLRHYEGLGFDLGRGDISLPVGRLKIYYW